MECNEKRIKLMLMKMYTLFRGKVVVAGLLLKNICVLFLVYCVFYDNILSCKVSNCSNIGTRFYRFFCKSFWSDFARGTLKSVLN